MPIDPSIPLGVRPVQIPDAMEAYGKAMTLRNLQTESQVKDIQLQQLKSQLLGEQTLAKMMGDPSKTTMQEGVPTLNPQAESELMQASPSFGMEHAKQMFEFKKSIQQMDTEKLTAAKTKVELTSKAAIGVMNTYQTALQQTGNPQQALQAATQARQQALTQLVQQGAIPLDQAQQMASQPFNPQEWQQKMMQGEDYYKMLTSEHQSRMENIASGGLSERQRHDKQMEGLASGAISGGITSDALDAAADRYNIDGTLPPLGMGRSGQNVRTQILNRAAERAMEQGGDTGSRSSQLANKATASGLAQLSRQKTMVSAFEKTATMNADLALEASKKVDRTGITFFNKWLQSGRTATGSVEAAQFNALNETFVNEYAKVMSGSMGNTPVSDQMRQHAHELLNTAHTEKQYEGIVTKLKQEMGNRMKGYDQEIKETKKSLSTKVKNMDQMDQSSDTPEVTPEESSDYSHLWNE